MVVLHSFLRIYSLRTGVTVSLVLSLVSLASFLIIGVTSQKNRDLILTPRPIILYLMWFCFTMIGFIGVYVERSTFLIPDLSRRILFIVLDVMGAISTYFNSELDVDTVPEIDLQWYTLADVNDSLYYVLVVLFLLTIPIKLYLFVLMLSYYILIKEDESHHETTRRPRTPSAVDE